ncbi:ethionine resistance-conferring protein 1 [Trichomonascus vanleenenianus]|uniref:MATE family efflux transporter n=1 Tax=Trichomonascus vanleenenianus TaxID=2268995 RepID=UPI003EC9761D
MVPDQNAGASAGYGTVNSDAVSDDKTTSELVTTVGYESRLLVKNTIPVSITFILQYFLSAASIFVVGHLGQKELAAISLVSVTVGVMGYAIIQGVATSLDTLAAQAYGRKDYKAVGVLVQRCAAFTFTLSIFIVFCWLNSRTLLSLVIPEKDLVEMASQCLKVYIMGLPGYIIFEMAKHFLQVQGIFHASTYILVICTPINLVLNYVLVWNQSIGLGFIGAPVAVVITDCLMAILSILYVAYVDGSKCWVPLSRECLRNWWPMMRLASAGVVMVEAEWLAFDLLTMACGQFGTTVLAAQSVMATLCAMMFQVPLAMGITASTRIGNLIGASSADAARTACKASVRTATVLGLTNAFIMYVCGRHLARVFTSDEAVIAIVVTLLPYSSMFQLSDAVQAITGGILRGQGRQWIGGFVNILFYYIVMLPCSLALAFVSGWGIEGLWAGMVFGLLGVCLTQLYFVDVSDWNSIIKQQYTC